MQIAFRSGILRHQTDLHGSAIFLKKSSNNVSIIVSPDPTIITFIDGTTDYVYTEFATVTNAWNTAVVGAYLFWEMDRVTGLISYGSTLLNPAISSVAPNSPGAGQLWFDSINKKWFRSNGISTWTQVLIVFATQVTGTSTLGSMSDRAPDFRGTQAGINTTQSAGSLVYDLAGKALQNSLGQFFTTEDDFIAGVPYGSSMRIEAIATYAIANQPFAKYSVVRFNDFNQIVPATSGSQIGHTIGVVEEVAVTGDRIRVVYAGPITNEDWDWSSLGVDAPIYVAIDGTLSSSPAASSQEPIARVIDKQTILFQPWLGVVSSSVSGGGGVTDHGLLTGLIDDDHAQYINNARGDIRYYTQSVANATFAAIGHNHDATYLMLAGGTMLGNLNMNGNRITTIPTTPTDPNDAASKAYVDSVTSGGVNVLDDLADVSNTVGSPGIDNFVLTYDDASGLWGAEVAAAGGLQNIVEDVTPQLGGALDVNNNSIISIDAATPNPVAILAGNTTAEYGYGGNVTLTAGTGDGGLTDASGGSVYINAGAGVGAYETSGGYVNITAGSSGFNGGNVNITGGAGITNGIGGKVSIIGGANGGQVTLIGGASGSLYNAASATVAGGQAGGAYNGGHAIIKGGITSSGTAGNVQLQPGLASVGSPGINGVIEIYGPGSSGTNLAAEVRFYEKGGLIPTGNNYIALKAPDGVSGTLTADRTWVLPVDDPASAEGKFLTTDAFGILSFATPAGGGGGSRINDLQDDTFIETDTVGDGTGNVIRFGVETQQIEMSDYFGQHMLIKGEDSTTAADGSSVKISGGIAQGTSTGDGGNAFVYGGNAYGASGNAGNVSIGSGFSNVACGNASLFARGTNVGTGGDTSVNAGRSGAGVRGGRISLDAGDGKGASDGGDGGPIQLQAGDAEGNGTDSGYIRIIAGVQNSTDNAATAGDISLEAGTVSTASTANGGDVLLKPGGGGDGGLLGAVLLQPGNFKNVGETVELRFYENSLGNYVGFKAPDPLAGNQIWTLPVADGNNNDVLTTDGAGVLTWEVGGGGGGGATPYDIIAQSIGVPTDGDVLTRMVFTRAVTVGSGSPVAHQGYAAIPPSGGAGTISVFKASPPFGGSPAGTLIGTLVFNNGSTSLDSETIAGTSFAVGDLIWFEMTSGNSMGDLTVTLDATAD